MKKLLTILIGCSLALAASATAQQGEASPAKKKKKQQQMESQHGPAQEAHPGVNRAHPATGLKPANEAKRKQNPNAMHKQHAQANAPAETKAASKSIAPSAAAVETRAHGKNADNTGVHQGGQMKKAHNAPNEAASTKKTAHPAAANAKAETSAPVEANPSAKKTKGHAKKLDPQVVQQVKTQHAHFKAQPKPKKVPTVTFNQSHRIHGAEHWQGPQYEVFRSYRPVWHDQHWYRSRYNRVEIIAGGAYYFLNGFWFPAWGYSPSYQYYAYDAPIYVGSRAEPPDRVIADVQAILQEEGYYKGEVDGLLGPLTREALTGYQTDNGLYPTAMIDEPTLASLDLG